MILFPKNEKIKFKYILISLTLNLLFNFKIYGQTINNNLFEVLKFNNDISNLPATGCRFNNDKLETKKWALLVYIAADNDLHYFAWNNIKQLANGANDNTYIIVQLNEPGKNKKTQRYLIEKNKAILLNKENTQKLDSGDPQTLIDFCVWAIKTFPALDYMLDLSNHGSGIVDRNSARLINPSELFFLNPSNLMLELDRSIEFLNFIGKPKKDISHNFDPRGVCFDETYNSYLNNQKLEFALKNICAEANKFLQRNDFKFSIFGVDACLMQMIEVANIVKKFAHIMVASEEVELGPGWRYDKILSPLQTTSLNYIEFARHIVRAYEDTYSGITNDFTLSAINLDIIDELEKNINSLSEIFIQLIQGQKDNSVKTVLKKSKSNVAFEEPSYVDIASFYTNLLKNLPEISLKNKNPNLIGQLQQTIQIGLQAIQKIVLESCAGSNLTYAKGLSIYFPEKRIHNSYRKTNFAQSNQWMNFLLHYIS